MTAKSRSRGHGIENVDGKWIFSDNQEPAFTKRPCHYCGKEPVKLYLFNSDTEQWGTKYIDACIAKIVNALQTHGIKMVSSCCGHHHRDGWIQLADGRLLKISKGE